MTEYHILYTSKPGSQKCYIGPSLFSDLQCKLGDPVVIANHNSCTLCGIWIRKDRSNQFVDFDATVSQDVTQSEIVNSNRNILTSSNFKILNKPELCTDINVSVVLSNYQQVAKFKTSSPFVGKLKEWIFNILKQKIVKSGFDFDCKSLELGSLYGISYIKILNIDCGSDCGYVDSSSCIKIDDVQSVERYEQIKRKTITRIGGLSTEVCLLKELVTLPCEQEIRIKQLGALIPKGALLIGPPGTGKTSLVQHVAQECGAYIMFIKSVDVVRARPGETQSEVEKLFCKATCLCKEGPCILFLDEIESLCPKLGRGTGSQESQLTLKILDLLDALPPHAPVFVIGATNRPDAVEPSIRRPGRLEKEIVLGIPRLHQRKDILQCILTDLPLHSNVNLDEVAASTPGFVGADLMALTQKALYNSGLLTNKDVTSVTLEHFTKALHSVVPSTQRGSDILVDYRPIQWDSIGGLENVKLQLKQAIEWPLLHPGAFQRLGLPTPKGVLLYGPPGCAKTTLVRAAATSCHVTFLAISGAQLFSPYVGDSEKKIAQVFQQARAGAPSILFIDEIDSIIGNRSKGEKQSGVQERVLSTLLNEMDGVGLKVQVHQGQKEKQLEGQSVTDTQVSVKEAPVDNSDVLVVAATNRPDMLDDALVRPGRIDRIIYVPLPDEKARHSILQVHTKKTPLQDVDLVQISEATDGYTGADIENLCKEAALCALTEDGLDAPHVKQKHFDSVLKTVPPSLTAQEIAEYSTLRHYRAGGTNR